MFRNDHGGQTFLWIQDGRFCQLYYIAQTSISLLTNADMNGRLLATDGAVTLQSNAITLIPEPSSGLLVLAGGITGLLYRRRRRIC